MKYFISPVKYQKQLPSLKDLQRATGAKNLILILDERLARVPALSRWQAQFAHCLPVRAGEHLKDILEFPRAVRSLLPMLSGHSASESAIVVVGGGSIGDWAGFLASVLKRGIGFINIPSTWLAAIDSAHGGKTALNVDAYKNQVGTFYPATAIYCVKEILDLQPQENVRSGYGEALKMAILSGGSLYKKFVGSKELNSEFLWKVLPQLVAAKYQVVKRDPFEKLGVRQILNLGHTMGHAVELEQKLPHGLAVQVGLEFSLEWSFRQGLIKARDYEPMKSLLAKNSVPPLARLQAERLRLCIQQDKKTHKGDEVGFVFIKGPGKPFVKNVKIDELIQVARDSGWVR